MLRSAAINTCVPRTPIWRPPGRVRSKNWSIRAVKRFFTVSTPQSAGFNHQPVISSTARLWGIIGHDYYYQPIASDVDNQPLTYQLLAAPEGMTLTGYEGGEQLIRYRPTAPGDYYVSLFVSDGIGGAAQNFQVHVGTYAGNEAPEFLSEPAASATAGREYRHQIQAADYEADPFVFLLADGPAGPGGMTIDSSTGLILWTPAADDVGSHAVTIAAVDSLGARSEQSFTLTVRGVNLGPAITSTPIVTARQGELYTYPVTARDPEGDAITFSLLPLPAGEGGGEGSSGGSEGIPAGMSINSVTGLISWTPAAGSESAVTVTVRVSDVYGSGSEQTFAINVAPAGENQGPVITSTPAVYYAVVGETYTYQVTAYDADPDTNLAYALAAGPADATFDVGTRTLSWTPTPGSAGASATVTITVDDGLLGAAQTFTLLAVNNTPPVLGSLADQQITAGQTMRLAIPVSDPEGYALAYELLDSAPGSETPADATVDEFGRITWTTAAADANSTATFTFIATDVYGASVLGSFTVTVNPDTQAPVFLIEQSADTIALGETATFVISVTDDVAFLPESLLIAVNGAPVPVSPVYGGYSFTYTATVAGQTTVSATATDAAGNVGTSEATLQVFDPTDPPPVLVFEDGLEGIEITAPRDILGLVDDPSDNLTNYRLSLVSEEGIERELAAGTTEVGSSASGTTGVLGQLDPTLLANGSYTLRLVAEDAAGNTSVAESIVHINGRLKLGNFNLSFTDLSLPLGGIPITISRTYDTLNADKQGDFGYGWNLDIANLSVRADVATLGAIPRDGASGGTSGGLAGLEDAGILTPWRYGTRLNVRLPDGTLERYTVSLKALEGAHGAGGFVSAMMNIYTIDLVPDRPTSGRLSLSDQWQVLLDTDTGELSTPDRVPFNPASSLLDIDYTYTTRDGVQYSLSGDNGKIQNITDRNGNRLEITTGGVRSVSPTGVTVAEIPFTRDSLGRITSITDPNGNSVRYTYDASSDLVSVTDRVDAVTQFTYDPTTSGGRLHFLTDITDPRGIVVLHSNFDETTGRLTSLTDSAGNSAPFEYDLNPPHLPIGQYLQTTRDAVGHSTETIRDQHGNILRTIQFLAHVTDDPVVGSPNYDHYIVSVFQYDSADNRVATSEPFGVHDLIVDPSDDTVRFTGSPILWTTRSTYDPYGNQLSYSNALGTTDYFTYNLYGQPTATLDALGNTDRSTYDPITGLLMQSVDPLNNVTQYFYTASGNLTSTIDALGHTIFTKIHDQRGLLTQTTTQSGITTSYSYDAVGRRTGTATLYVNPDDPNDQHLITTSNEYDSGGRRIRSTDTSGQATTFAYDITGHIVSSTDPFGNSSLIDEKYNSRGLLVERRTPGKNSDGTDVVIVQQTVYDQNGRAILTTDSYRYGTSVGDIWATRTTYDALGRAITTDRLRGPEISIVPASVNGVWESSIITFGVVQNTSSRVLDPAGRTVRTVDSLGTITEFAYDLAGRMISTTIGAGMFDYRTVTAYDAAGHVKLVRDASNRETRFTYDALGRRTIVEYHDGTSTTASYDTLGRTIAETDQLGRTTQYVYSTEGNLVAVLLSAMPSPTSEESLVVPAYEYEYDPYGSLRVIRDPLGRETQFTYDAWGAQTSRRLPLGQTERKSYNQHGQLQEEVSFEGVVTRYAYDNSQVGQGRLLRTEYFASTESAVAGEVVTYEYDWRNQVTSISQRFDNEDQRIEVREYDMFGKLIQIASPEGIINYAYDDLTGQTVRVWTSTDKSANDYLTDTRYGYDTLGRLVTVTPYGRFGQQTGEAAATYTYSPTGAISVVTLPNGMTVEYDYDTLGRLTAVTNYSPDETVSLDGNPLFSRFEYTLRANGVRSSVREIDRDGNETTVVWSYDALDRLVREEYVSYDHALVYERTYTMDLVGNRLSRSTDSGMDGVRDELIVYAYDENDRLLAEASDENGDGSADRYTVFSWGTGEASHLTMKLVMSSDATTVVESTRYGYDLRGHLALAELTKFDEFGIPQSSVSKYLYDDDGVRVGQIVEGGLAERAQTDYVNDKMNPTGYSQVLEQRTPGEVTPQLAYLLARDVLSQSRNGETPFYLVYDGTGSTRALADHAGMPVVGQVYRYDAYGVSLGGGDPISALGYSGEISDSATSLIYLRNRYWSPSIGRFVAADRFPGALKVPLSLHRYVYAHDNPVNNVDPTGLAVYLVSRAFLGANAADQRSRNEMWRGQGTLAIDHGPALGVRPLRIAHGYLMFTDPGNAGVMRDRQGNVMETIDYSTEEASSQPRLRRRQWTFSWHPNRWYPNAGHSITQVPGRVWANHPGDFSPGANVLGGAAAPIDFEVVLVTADPGIQAALVADVTAWRAANRTGYELGAPMAAAGEPGNDWGADEHVAPGVDPAQYWLTGQNCFWWTKIMLDRAGIQVSPNRNSEVYGFYSRFNAGVGVFIRQPSGSAIEGLTTGMTVSLFSGAR